MEGANQKTQPAAVPPPVPVPAPVVSTTSSSQVTVNKSGGNYKLLFLLALIVFVGAIAGFVYFLISSNSDSDVSVASEDGTLDLWGDCTQNFNACKTGLDCVEVSKDSYVCSSLSIGYACDKTDMTCNTGYCNEQVDPTGKGDSVFVCGYTQTSQTTDNTDNQTVEGLDLWEDCTQNREACMEGLDCVEVSTDSYVCSSLSIGYACDKTDMVCDTGFCNEQSDPTKQGESVFVCEATQAVNIETTDKTTTDTSGTETTGNTVEQLELCGPLDVNESNKIDLADFDNIVRRWGDSCAPSI